MNSHSLGNPEPDSWPLGKTACSGGKYEQARSKHADCALKSGFQTFMMCPGIFFAILDAVGLFIWLRLWSATGPL